MFVVFVLHQGWPSCFLVALHQTCQLQENFIGGNSNITSPSNLGGRYYTILFEMASWSRCCNLFLRTFVNANRFKHITMFEIFWTSTSKHKRLWYDNDYNTIGFRTSYASSFVELLNARIIGSILTLPNPYASNWGWNLFLFSPITWYVLSERSHLLLEAFSMGFCKMACVTFPIKFNTTFSSKMKLIWNLKLIEKVQSWTIAFWSFTYMTKGTMPFSRKISTSIESTIMFKD